MYKNSISLQSQPFLQPQSQPQPCPPPQQLQSNKSMSISQQFPPPLNILPSSSNKDFAFPSPTVASADTRPSARFFFGTISAYLISVYGIFGVALQKLVKIICVFFSAVVHCNGRGIRFDGETPNCVRVSALPPTQSAVGYRLAEVQQKELS